MAGKLKISVPGRALHVAVSKPDDRFNKENPPFKIKLIPSVEDAEVFKAEIDKAVDEAHEVHTSTLPVAQKKLWSKSYPYEDELDKETGEPTGRTIFKFKQNSKIRRKDGSTSDVKILVVDAKKKKTTAPVWSGDLVRIAYKFRTKKDGTIDPMVIATSKQVTVRLDFAQVQILQKRQTGEGSAFDEFEGGWEADEDEFSSNEADISKAAASNDGDF